MNYLHQPRLHGVKTRSVAFGKVPRAEWLWKENVELAAVDSGPGAPSVPSLGWGCVSAAQRGAQRSPDLQDGEGEVPGGYKELSPFLLGAGIPLTLAKNNS